MQVLNHHPINKVPNLVRQLYQLVAEFESLFPGRKFTPDGHLVGSIGEVVAAHRYGLDLYAASTEGHDAQASDGRKVEIKATQGNAVALRASSVHLIVLHLARTEVVQRCLTGQVPWLGHIAVQCKRTVNARFPSLS